MAAKTTLTTLRRLWRAARKKQARLALLAAVAIRPFLGFMKRFKTHFNTLEKIMGLLLIITGLLFIFGAQNWFSQWMIENFPGLARIESLITPADLGSEILKQGTP